jgi:nicotinamidase-related amidase
MLPLPSFYEPHRVGELYLERAALIAAGADAYASQHRIAAASKDAPRIAALGIDVQVAFCTPGASLFVPGAVEDTQRTLAWLYGNLGRLTELVFSLDTHRALQIFHPAWWRDAEGRHPAPFSSLSRADVESGRWVGREPEASIEYVRRLEEGGKYVLTIWPYHALLGGLSHALVPAMAEAALFHSLVRQQPTQFEIKGTAAETENYSVLSPEVKQLGGREVGRFNDALFEKLMGFDRVYVFGQAKSHCVLSTLFDLRDRIRAVDAKLASKVWILTDAMSPVPPPPVTPLPPALDFPRLAEEGLRELAAFGMRLVKTTDPL